MGSKPIVRAIIYKERPPADVGGLLRYVIGELVDLTNVAIGDHDPRIFSNAFSSFKRAFSCFMALLSFGRLLSIRPA